MSVQNHTHQYQQIKKRPGWWKCAAPDCSHIQQHELVVGKHSICNLCGNEFVLDRDAARRKIPRCAMCSDTAKGKAARAAQSVASSLLVDLIKKEEEVNKLL